MLIYLATNLKNGKRYVGITARTLKHRRSAHFVEMRRGSKQVFHRALRKHGSDNFKWKILCFCKDYDELKAREVER